MQEDLKNILLEKVNDYDVIDHMYDYLKNYNQPQSSFNNDAFYKLQILLMHQFHNHNNLSSLGFRYSMLHEISCGLSLEEFENKIKGLNYISTDTRLNLEQLVFNAFNREVLSLGGWFKIYADKIKGTTISNPTHRIYLAVDNSCLHRFALLLLQQCSLRHIQYQFKINNGNLQNNYDNVVIYTNEEELPKYIHSIETILNKNKKIKFNQQCLIAYPYDKNIAIAPYIDTKTESYSQIVCNSISYYRDNAESKLEFISNVDQYFNKVLGSTKRLCEEIRMTRTISNNISANVNSKRR